jgi:hypothetical protein
MNYLKHLIAGLALGLIVLCSQADAGTVYVDTAGANGALATNSGSTDTTTPTATGTAASNVGTTVTLDVSTNLGTVITTPGLTQSSINIAGATNANRTLFWITGVTSGCTGTAVACIITVDTAPTGLTSNAWAVGGRYLWPSGSTANVVEGALGLSTGSDVVTFNTSPAARTTVFATLRNPGTSSTGNLVFQGKAGTLPVLTISSGSSSQFFNINNQANWTFSNLSFSNLSTAVAIANSNTNLVLQNVKIAGGAGLGTLSLQDKMIGGEISGSSGDGIAVSNNSFIKGVYIHGNTGNGITVSVLNPISVIVNNLITGNSKGISLSGASNTPGFGVTIDHNTIYGNSSDGLNVANANTVVTLTNNIFQDNGQTSGYNVNWAAGTAQLFSTHSNNVFYQSGAGTPTGNLLNLTANSTEFTTNPLFANAGSANFAIGNLSPAAGSGVPSVFPSIGTGLTSSFPDMGAAQRQVTAGSGGYIIGGGL